jgi:hypothetical protein
MSVYDRWQYKLGEGVQQAVNRFKSMAHLLQSQDVFKRARILTDLSGRFETVTFEAEVESLYAYFAMMRAAFADPEIPTTMGEMPFQSGSRAFYTIEATY